MRALTHDLAVVEHDDAVGVHDGADALGHDELGGILGLAGERVAHFAVGLEVERGERVVENQDFRVTVHRARNRQALLLAAGHVRSALGDRGGIPAVHARHELAGLRHVGGGPDAIQLLGRYIGTFRGLASGDQRGLALAPGRGGGIGHLDLRRVARLIAVAHVGGHGAPEQHGLLRHVADLVAQGLQVVVAHVHAVDQHLALAGVIEARHEIDKRRLAGAGGADERHRLALLGGEVDAFQHRLARIRVGEADVAEFHGASLTGFGHVGGGFGAVLDDRLGVEYLHDALRGHVGARPEHEHHAHEQEAHDDLHGVVGKHHHVGEHGELVLEPGGVDEVSADPVDGEHQAVQDGVHQRHHERHDAVGEQLGLGEVLVGLGEFGFLVVLGIVGAHHAQAGEVLAGHEVDVVGQGLHDLELRHDHSHHDGDGHQQDRHGDAGGERPFEAFAGDLAHGPYGHDRRLDDELQAHGDEHLHLRDVVGGTGDEAGGGELAHLGRAEGLDLAEFERAQTLGERGGHARSDVAGDDGTRHGSKRDEQHLAARDPDVLHVAARRLDQRGDV